MCCGIEAESKRGKPQDSGRSRHSRAIRRNNQAGGEVTCYLHATRHDNLCPTIICYQASSALFRRPATLDLQVWPYFRAFTNTISP